MAKLVSYLIVGMLALAVVARGQDYDYTGGAPLRMLANSTPSPTPTAAGNKTNGTTTKKSSAEVDGAQNLATFSTSALLAVLGASLMK